MLTFIIFLGLILTVKLIGDIIDSICDDKLAFHAWEYADSSYGPWCRGPEIKYHYRRCKKCQRAESRDNY